MNQGMQAKQHTPILSLGLAVLLALLIMPGPVAAQDASAGAGQDSIIGTWRLQVAPVDCPSGAGGQPGRPTGEPGVALLSYLPGGVLVITRGRAPTPTTVRGPLVTSGQGIWEQTGMTPTGDLLYRAFFTFFRFRADGTVVGSLEVTNENTQLIKEASSNAFNTFIVPLSRAKSLDANGQVLEENICTSVTGQRVTFPG